MRKKGNTLVKIWLLGYNQIQSFWLFLSTFSHFLENDKHNYDNGKIISYFLLLLIKKYDVYRLYRFLIFFLFFIYVKNNYLSIENN